MIYVTDRHMEGGSGHQHIASVLWRNSSTGATGESSREGMVTYIDGGNEARVQGTPDALIGVVHTQPHDYIRTHADGQWTNNLLSLPTY